MRIYIEEFCNESFLKRTKRTVTYDFGYSDPIASTSDAESSEEESEVTVSADSDLGCQSFIPQSLANPRNHCYINSCLQVLYRILMHFNEGIHFNTNAEGCLTRSLVEGVYSDSRDSLSCFKQQLAQFDHFFNGVNQQDVAECFGFLMDILHLGTKRKSIVSSRCRYSGGRPIHSFTD